MVFKTGRLAIASDALNSNMFEFLFLKFGFGGVQEVRRMLCAWQGFIPCSAELSETLFKLRAIFDRLTQWARKVKKVQAKKTRETKKINFTKKFLGQISFFAISKMAKNRLLNWDKV